MLHPVTARETTATTIVIIMTQVLVVEITYRVQMIIVRHYFSQKTQMVLLVLLHPVVV
jgi:hypothetical protein